VFNFVLASLRNLRHERDMLYKHMLKKLHLPERECLYTKWGIDLNSKQRRLQLSRRIWTQTEMEHVRESAALVAKLVEHLERGQAIKEMFGLSFTLNPLDDRRSFSWVGA
jgi:centromeric protein E